jgi:DNA-binding response OmpR family regulator
MDIWSDESAMETTTPQKQIYLAAGPAQPAFKILHSYLVSAGFAVVAIADRDDLIPRLTEAQAHLLILDLDLTAPAQVDFYRALRRATDCPILLCTAHVELASRLIDGGLAVDDYIAKPFSPYKVVTRVHAIFQHLANRQAAEDVICFGDLVIDLQGHSVARANQNIVLSRTEFNILALLTQHPQRTFSRAQLIALLKGRAPALAERTIDAHIKNLRSKLEPDPRNPVYIRTVYGFGYKFTWALAQAADRGAA